MTSLRTASDAPRCPDSARFSYRDDLATQFLLGLVALLVLGLGRGARADSPHLPEENLALAATPGFELARDVEPDGQGGMWVVWDISVEGMEGPVLQRVDADGELLFGPSGVRLSTATASVFRMDILPADDGGVFVAWEDNRSGVSSDIYMQRVLPTGGLLWDSAGVLVASGPDVAVAVGNGGIISHSLDGGDSWSAVTSGTGQSLLGVDVVSGRILAAGDAGTFLESTDLGASWSVLRTGGWPDLNALDLFVSGRGVAVGDDGISWTWDGQQWTASPGGIATDFLGVSMPDYDIVTAVGRDGRIARSTDGGVSWTEQTSGVGGHLHDVCFSSPDVGAAVGVGGIILRTDDGGTTWVSQVSGTSQTLLAVDFLDDQIGVATGYGGVALWTDDGGSTWTSGNTPVVIWYMGVDITDANTAVAVGQDRIIIKTVDGGANWTVQQPTSGTVDFWEVSAPGNVTRQIAPMLVDDGSGGAIAVWLGQEPGIYQVMAQRIDALANLVWPSAVQISSAPSNVGESFAVPRGDGGAIVVWSEAPSPPDVELYTQSIDLDGTLVHAQPLVVSDHASGKYQLDVAADGRGGAIVGWQDNRAAPSGIYARRLDDSGYPRWTQNGKAISADASGGQFDPAVVADGLGGAFFVWEENRGNGTDLYAQRADQHGDPQWTGGDVRICGDPGTQLRPFATADGFGGFVAGWLDYRTVDYQLYAQAVTAEGVPRWEPNGVPVRVGAAGGIHSTPSVLYIVPDDAGGALMVWGDNRDGSTNSWDIYAQNVDRHGYLGSARASITSVVDVPQDQGGFATVSWDASYLDAFPNQLITQYSVWRRDPSTGSQSIVVTTAAVANETVGPSPEAALEAGLPADLVAAQAATGWLFVDTSATAYLPSYGYAAPTFGDETPTQTPMTEFQVIAHTADPFVFWTSSAASGTSIDNLAPDAPLSLLAAELGGQVELVWNDGLAYVEDVDHYRVYRGAGSGFTVGPSSYLASAPQKIHLDASPGGAAVYYRVTAVDVHGNESAPSNEAMATVVTAASLPTETSVGLRLATPFPNPSDGSSLVRFALPFRGRARLELYDLAGRRVREMDLGMLPAGWHQRAMGAYDRAGKPLASGTYLLRLTQGDRQRTTKVMVAR